MLPFKEESPNGKAVFSKVPMLILTAAAGEYRFNYSASFGDSKEIYEQAFGARKIPKL